MAATVASVAGASAAAPNFQSAQESQTVKNILATNLQKVPTTIPQISYNSFLREVVLFNRGAGMTVSQVSDLVRTKITVILDKMKHEPRKGGKRLTFSMRKKHQKAQQSKSKQIIYEIAASTDNIKDAIKHITNGDYTDGQSEYVKMLSMAAYKNCGEHRKAAREMFERLSADKQCWGAWNVSKTLPIGSNNMLEGHLVKVHGQASVGYPSKFGFPPRPASDCEQELTTTSTNGNLDVWKSSSTTSACVCYICGFPLGSGSRSDPKPECEHVLPVLHASQWLALYQGFKDGAKYPRGILYEYLWAHKCCNRIKNNDSWITMDGAGQMKPDVTNIKKSLRGIQDDTYRAAAYPGSGRGDCQEYLCHTDPALCQVQTMHNALPSLLPLTNPAAPATANAGIYDSTWVNARAAAIEEVLNPICTYINDTFTDLVKGTSGLPPTVTPADIATINAAWSLIHAFASMTVFGWAVFSGCAREGGGGVAEGGGGKAIKDKRTYAAPRTQPYSKNLGSTTSRRQSIRDSVDKRCDDLMVNEDVVKTFIDIVGNYNNLEETEEAVVDAAGDQPFESILSNPPPEQPRSPQSSRPMGSGGGSRKRRKKSKKGKKSRKHVKKSKRIVRKKKRKQQTRKRHS